MAVHAVDFVDHTYFPDKEIKQGEGITLVYIGYEEGKSLTRMDGVKWYKWSPENDKWMDLPQTGIASNIFTIFNFSEKHLGCYLMMIEGDSFHHVFHLFMA